MVDVVMGVISANELRTLTHGETDYGGIVPLKSMGDRGIEVKHTLQAVEIHKENRVSTGRLNVILQNCSGNTVKILKGEEIGGYKPQCEQSEDRYDLASVQGTRLAAALDLGGAVLLDRLGTNLAKIGKEARTDGLSGKTHEPEKKRDGHTSMGVGSNERANKLWPENSGSIHEQMEHTTNIQDGSSQESESVRGNTCESVRRECARVVRHTPISNIIYRPKRKLPDCGRSP